MNYLILAYSGEGYGVIVREADSYAEAREKARWYGNHAGMKKTKIISLHTGAEWEKDWPLYSAKQKEGVA